MTDLALVTLVTLKYTPSTIGQENMIYMVKFVPLVVIKGGGVKIV
jgi:hypothetical protein